MDKQVIMVFLKEMFLNDSSLHWKNKKIKKIEFLLFL
jgi:hypothetical protein